MVSSDTVPAVFNHDLSFLFIGNATPQNKGLQPLVYCDAVVIKYYMPTAEDTVRKKSLGLTGFRR